jgi:hypothetical protein
MRNGDMSCPYTTRDYVEYLTAELDGARRTSLEAHIPGCLRCRVEIAVHGEVLEGLRAMRSKEPPADFSESVLRALFTQKPVPRWRRASLFDRILALTATQALLVTFFFAVRDLAGRSAVTAWGIVGDGVTELLRMSREALVLLVSLTRVAEVMGKVLANVGRVLDPEALFRQAVPIESVFLVLGFMLLTSAILRRLVGQPLQGSKEVRHAHS